MSHGYSPASTSRRRLLQGLLAAPIISTLGTAHSASAGYPSKPVKLTVPFSAGGATDTLGRILAQAMEPRLKQTVVVENRVGASGAIGAAAVARSAPDGYNLLMGGVGTNIVLAYTLPSLAYDPVRDLMPVIHLCNVDYVLAVPKDSPFRTVEDLIAAARAKPRSISYMSTGPLGPLHIAMEHLTKQAGVEMVHVPYAGEAPALPDLLEGRVDVAMMTVLFTRPMVAEGRLRALATLSGQRAAGLPALATVAEQGFPDFAVPIWNGLFVPSGTDPAIIDSLNRANADLLADAAIRQRLVELGVTPTGSTPQAYATFLDQERARWSTMIKSVGELS